MLLCCRLLWRLVQNFSDRQLSKKQGLVNTKGVCPKGLDIPLCISWCLFLICSGEISFEKVAAGPEGPAGGKRSKGILKTAQKISASRTSENG